VVASAGARASVTVRDRGIGISSEDQQRIFERFERAVSVRHYGGFGVGLWLARQAVEAHGGEIHVRSEHGAGSEFRIELPLQAPPA
jgi:signal transduction histidine kinase